MYGFQLKEKFGERCKTVDELAIYLANRSEGHANFSILLGAGASQSSSVKTGRDLVAQWRKKYFLKLSENTEESYSDEAAKVWLSENCNDWYKVDKEYSSLFERIFDTPSQRRIFVEGQVKDAIPSVGYAYLSRLVNEKYINTIFTTNFDDLVNESLYMFGSTRPIVCAHDSSVEGILVTSPRPKVIKLHGDYLFDDLKCTIDDTEALEVNMNEKFTQFLREYGLIVMGYSGDDDSIMSVLESLLDKPSYMRNGLYWCMRENSFLSDRVVKLLEKKRVYIVFIDGFDGALASLCNEISPTKSPIPELSNGSNNFNIIKRWVDDKEALYANNPVIVEHLNYLERSQSKSQLAEAIAELHSDSQDAEQGLNQFNDQQVTSLLHIKKLYNQCDYFEAVDAAEEALKASTDNDFREKIFLSIYSCWKQLGDRDKAKEVCSSLQKISPNNPSHLIREFDVEDNFIKKKRIFDKAIEKDNYFWETHYRYSRHLYECIVTGLTHKNTDNFKEIINSLKISLDCRPSFKNPAWNLLFNVQIKAASFIDLKTEMQDSINVLKKQDPYSPKILSAIYDLCKHLNDEEAFGESIFSLIDKSSKNYYPNHSPCLLRVSVDAAIEFNRHEYAESKIEEIENNAKTMDDIYNNSSYILAKSDFLLDVHQDIEEAINCIKEAIATNSNCSLLSKLIELCCKISRTDQADVFFHKNENVFDRKERILLRTRILEAKGKYKEALISLDELKEDPDFERKYGARKSYIYLLNNDFEQAKKYCSTVLNRIGWDMDNFAVLVINYEYACSKLDKPHKKRLVAILQSSSSEDEKAMANLLLGNDNECLALMRKSIKKEFSSYYEYSSWPVAESIIPQLNRELDLNPRLMKVV